MSKQFCSSCGKQIETDSKFCVYCGQQTAPSVTQTEETPQSPDAHIKRKNWFFVGGIVAVIIVVFFIFSKDSPEKVAENFVDHVASYEIKKAHNMLARDADEYLRDELEWMLDEIKDDPSFIDEGMEYAKEAGYAVTDFSIHDTDVSDDFASIEGKVTYSDDDTETIYIELVKEDGKWKVQDSY